MSPTLANILQTISTSFELSLIVKATVALMVGLMAVRLARRARASVRHLVLASTFAGLLALPFVAAWLPNVAFELPDAGMSDATAASARAGTAPDVVGAAGAAAETDTGAGRRSAADTNSRLLLGGRVSASALWTAARLAWAIPAAILMLSLAIGSWRLARIRRYGVPSLALRDVVRGLGAAMGLRRSVEVIMHDAVATPLTYGLVRPVIALPSDAAAWPDADTRRALVHELEHVRRGDLAVQLMARLTCALYWFHPLVWVAWRELAVEAERACDDVVIQTGEGAQTDYAEQLVEIARRLRRAPAQLAVPMASRSDLSVRVSALLDDRQPRGRAGTVSTVLAATLAAVLILSIAPLAAVRASTTSAKSEASEARDRMANVRDRALAEAAEQGDLEAITAMLDAGANVNAALSRDGSPLIMAARSGQLPAVRLLLERGADPNMPVPGDGNPIIMAAREGHADIVSLLLQHGASIDQVVPGDENALISASGAGELAVVKLLVLHGADVNATVWAESWRNQSAGEWRTPLSMARKGHHEAVIAFLLSAGARD